MEQASSTFESQVLDDLAHLRADVAELNERLDRIENGIALAITRAKVELDKARTQIAGSSLAKILGLKP